MRAALEPDPAFFEPIRPPRPGDWLARHPEPGQPFLAYAGHLDRQMREPARKSLCILPLGDFPAGSPALESMRLYCEAFFGKPTRLLKTVALGDVPAKRRHSPITHNLQLQSTGILDWLPEQKPADAIAVIAVTMADLYPKEGWNYVFGQAMLEGGFGVFSFARYDPAFYGEIDAVRNQELVLRRGCKVLAHEMGHMFGLHHCV